VKRAPASRTRRTIRPAGFRDCVLEFTVETPADIERRIGMTDG
jgi:hypothetical protein